VTLSDLVSEIDSNRQPGNLSSAIRLFVLGHFKARAPSPAAGPKASPLRAWSAGRATRRPPFAVKRTRLLG